MTSSQVEISILMSVYNETESEVMESVTSLLEQTYSNFEILIVNDNPSSEANQALLRKVAVLDPRIRIIHNSANIGLAMSMNHAAEYARGAYIARMDADDVCYPTRLEKQMEIMKTGEYDLVCTGFIYINERSEHLTEKDRNDFALTPEQIRQALPFKSVIHHPTVIMTRKIFDKVQGYRNFPCSQDYDLWLRLLTADARFYIIPEPLLKYRIRGSSITSTKRMRQKLTLEYIRNLYIERLKTGSDSFSPQRYQAYISRYLKDEKKQSALIEQGDAHLSKANRMAEQGNRLGALAVKVCVTLFNPVYRHVYSNLLLKKLEIKFLQRKHNG